MPGPAAASRIAVIDIGSNSLRLVVFERLGSALLALLNEKVMCGLGRGIATSGRLNPDGLVLARTNLRRFVALARAVGVDHLAVIATAAMREAADGLEFAAEIERECDVRVRIIDGVEEARLSAAGVLAGIPDADGVVGDLGGGSVELIRVGRDRRGPNLGVGISLPIGPLRLVEFGDNPKTIGEAVDRAVADAPVLRAASGRTLYLVGGAWRAIARLHMEHAKYPLHIIHQYTITRRQAEAFLDVTGRLSRRSLERITTVTRKRLEVVPLAAMILRRLIAVAKPDRVTFSAYGLREGYAAGLIPPEERDRDPLLDAAKFTVANQSRFRIDGDRLHEWVSVLFPGLLPAGERLHRAACWLSDIGWSEHPDYRAEQAFARSLRMPFAAIGHAERAFVAQTLHTRYGGPTDAALIAPTRGLLDDRNAQEARSLGLALRLAYTLSGGALDLVDEVRLARDGDALVLEVPATGSLYAGEAVQRRLEALARSLGLAARIRRRSDEQRIVA